MTLVAPVEAHSHLDLPDEPRSRLMSFRLRTNLYIRESVSSPVRLRGVTPPAGVFPGKRTVGWVCACEGQWVLCRGGVDLAHAADHHNGKHVSEGSDGWIFIYWDQCCQGGRLVSYGWVGDGEGHVGVDLGHTGRGGGHHLLPSHWQCDVFYCLEPTLRNGLMGYSP